MTTKPPLPTAELIDRLRRVAQHLDAQANKLEGAGAGDEAVAAPRARANTCWQAAGRLADLTAREGPPIPAKPVVDDDEPWRPKHSKRAVQERLSVSGDVDE